MAREHAPPGTRSAASNPDVHGYRRLLATYLGPQWPRVALMAALLIAGVGLQLVGPQVVRGFIESVRAGAPQEALIRAALLFLACSFAQRVAQVFAAYWSERVAWTATNALRADLAAHLLHLDPSFHKTHTPGALIERVDGDVGALASFFSTFVVRLVSSALLLLGVLAAVLLVDLRLGFGFALFAAGALALIGWVRRFGTAHWDADRSQSAVAGGRDRRGLITQPGTRASG